METFLGGADPQQKDIKARVFEVVKGARQRGPHGDAMSFSACKISCQSMAKQ